MGKTVRRKKSKMFEILVDLDTLNEMRKEGYEIFAWDYHREDMDLRPLFWIYGFTNNPYQEKQIMRRFLENESE